MDTKSVESLARDLMIAHGLTAKGWTFQFDQSVRRMGLCRFVPKVISVSKTLADLNSEQTMRDTILHEIAHALAGSQAGHGILWKLQARALGARPEACCKVSQVVQVETAWQGVCLDCSVKVSRTRVPDLARKYSHRDCRHKLNAGKVVWHFHGKPVSGQV